MKKQRRTKELRVIVSESMHEELKKLAGDYLTLSEMIRQILVERLKQK
jgi:hypothetical protein